jgi:hypothetical protein
MGVFGVMVFNINLGGSNQVYLTPWTTRATNWKIMTKVVALLGKKTLCPRSAHGLTSFVHL